MTLHEQLAGHLLLSHGSPLVRLSSWTHAPFRLRWLLATRRNTEQASLLAAIKLITRITPRFTAASLEQVLSLVLPSLFRGYKHPAAEIRKAVVFALVELHLVLGPSLDAHLTYVQDMHFLRGPLALLLLRVLSCSGFSLVLTLDMCCFVCLPSLPPVADVDCNNTCLGTCG